ncbi:MAG: hypothetical protein QOI02_445 [Actinomycetota bacterium]|jgi:hypothetical protein|nr:hypothetical protein [Actinomycetota bacterium]
MQGYTTEQLLPVLSPGRHRNPRQGACFMEFASYLAGQRWSDRPTCTHPSVAALARLVNDVSSHAARARLTVLIPSVVGLNGDDPLVPIIVSVLAASSALPIASESRQRSLASGLLRCEALLEGVSGAPADLARDRIATAMAAAPGAARWAHQFASETYVSPRQRRLLPADDTILRVAVLGIADACVRDADDRLVALLETAIADVDSMLRPTRVDQALPQLISA